MNVIPKRSITMQMQVDEADILSVAPGQEAEISVDAIPGRVFEGKVISIDPVGKYKSGSTRYTVSLDCGWDEDMYHGMNATAILEVGKKDGILTLPVAALYEEGGRTVVYTDYDAKSKTIGSPVEVETGVSDGYTAEIISGLGDITLEADDRELTGLWFEGQKYYPDYSEKEFDEKETRALRLAKEWLDIYFSGKEPDIKVPMRFSGTAFRNEVWEILLSIPYGKTVTYGQIAEMLAKKRGTERMSARAVGGAVGHNRISIIVPCHRVIGSDGSLTGYAGGTERKRELLKLEGVLL